MTVYEYKVITLSPISIDTAELERRLNTYGSNGWYVVHNASDYLLLERTIYNPEEESRERRVQE